MSEAAPPVNQPPMRPLFFDTVVFSGGGPFCVAMVGCLRYLEHAGDVLGLARTLVGASAGAIVALLCCLGLDADAVEAWVQSHWRTFSMLDLERILDLPERMGLDDGGRIMACIRGTIEERLGPQEGEITFAQLCKATGRSLVVCVANLSTVSSEYMGIESTPDMPVLRAIRMSISVPLLYTPVVHHGSVYADGGLFDNCPTHTEAWARSSRCSSILVLRLIPEGGAARLPTDLFQFMGLVLEALIMRANKAAEAPASPPAAISSESAPRSCVEVTMSVPSIWTSNEGASVFDFRTLTYTLPGDSMRSLVDLGYSCCRDVLEARQ